MTYERKNSGNDNFLKTLIDAGVFKYLEEPVRLQSGRMSHFYVSGRAELTSSPTVALTVGTIMARKILELTTPTDPEKKRPRILCIGIPVVGTGLAAATVMAKLFMDGYRGDNGQFSANEDFAYLIMREQKKSHGKDQSWLNGKPEEGVQYILVDNVLTTGDTMIEAGNKLYQDGFDVGSILPVVFVNRGDTVAIRRVAHETDFNSVCSALSLKDVVGTAERHGWWPQGVSYQYQLEQHEAGIRENGA